MTKNYDPLRNDKYLFGRKIDESNHDHVKKIDEEIERKVNGDKVLVVASGNEIFVIDGDDVRKIAKNHDWFYALCIYKKKMYHGCHLGVYQTFDNIKVANRDGWVLALCSDGSNNLYDAGSYGIYDYDIYDTLSGKIVAKREYRVKALCFHHNTLYDGDELGIIRDTLSNKMVAKRQGKVLALCSDGSNNLYDAGSYGIYDTLNNCRVIETKKEVDALCFYNGKLHYASGKEIYDITGNLIGTFSNSITAMISVEREVVGLNSYNHL